MGINSTKLDWFKLKQDYLYGDMGSINEFLRSRGIAINGSVSRKVKGWREERDSYLIKLEEATQQKVIDQVSETEAQIRTRQAITAKDLQQKAKKYLDEVGFNNPATALRAVEVGLREERKALGIDVEKLETKNTFNPLVFSTRYGKMLKEATNEDLIRILQEIDRLEKLDNKALTP